MFNAIYFTYDGIFSGEYGLVLANMNNNPVVETSAFSPTLNTIKPASLNRFFHNGIKYESAPQHKFSVFCEKEIPDFQRREILSWLIGRNEFKKLQIHQGDLEAYYYNCVFTNADIIYINGKCHGFNLTANFDSPYARGDSTSIKSTSSVTGATMHIYNRSDIMDGYVYPIVKFNGPSISILNNTDDSNRTFKFSGLLSNEQITVDNELR